MASAYSQTIDIDWETDTLDHAPSELSGVVTAKVVVHNVNDLLFAYKVSIRETARGTDDLGLLTQFLSKNTGRTEAVADVKAPACLETFNSLKRTLAAILEVVEKDPGFNPEPVGDTFRSVPLQETVTAWNKIEGLVRLSEQLHDALVADAAKTDCTGAIKNDITDFLSTTWHEFLKKIGTIRNKANGPHTYEERITLRPDYDYAITVAEYYKGKLTKQRTFDVKPTSNILTLSAGPMFTGIRNPVYEGRRVPVNGGDPITALVVSQNSGYRTTGVAQLNYLLPWQGVSGHSLGLALSLGPSIRLSGGEQDVSALGFFGGISVYLWRRLFLTPGVHVGEFADFPAGFFPGRPIPTDFGELNPVKRVTVKFGLGISFKVADFSRFIPKTTTEPTTANKSTEAKPTEAKPAKAKPQK